MAETDLVVRVELSPEVVRIFQELRERLDHIETLCKKAVGLTLTEHRKDIEMAKSIERIATEVSENGDAVEAAVALIRGLAQQIRDAGTDEDRLSKLADDLDASQRRLAEAVVANTPHDPSGM